MKNKKGRRTIQIVIIIIAVAVLAVAAYKLFSIGSEYQRAKNSFQEIEEVVVDTDTDEDDFVIDWDALHEMNPEIIAWIRIPGLDISYPVLQTTDNDKYLHAGVDGTYLVSGCIFMDYRNIALTDMNTILYGHNMNNGSMFGKLHKLESKDVWETANYFLIYTPGTTYRYDIFSCYNTPDVSYKIYHARCDEYTEYVEGLKASSAYDTGIEVTGDDHIVTLSTCTSYGQRYQYRWIVSGVLADKTS